MATMLRLIMTGLVLTGILSAKELIVTEDSTYYEGGTYERVIIDGRRQVTLRNVTVRNTSGQNYYAGIQLSGAKYITIENCEVDGGAQAKRGLGTCGGIKLDGASRVTIKNCKIHNLNDDGIRLYTATLVDIIGNEITNLRSCGTDPNPDCANCNNGHSDGIQLIECIKVNVIGNFIHNDHWGTSGIMTNGGSYNKEIVIADNIVSTPECWFTTYIWWTEGIKVYNNTFWDYKKNGASVWYGANLYRFEMVNNVIKKVTFRNGGSYNAAQHTIKNNLFAMAFNYGTNNKQGVDPQLAGVSPAENTKKFAPKPADYNPKSGSPVINAGTTGSLVPEVDFYGKGRSGAPDMGGIEYNGVTVSSGNASFTAANRTGKAPLAVQFTNTSTGTFTGWQWDFGDGGTSAQKSPSHTYQLPGRYTVTLTATGSKGNDVHTARYYIKATSDGSSPDTSGTTPQPIHLKVNAGPGTVTGWEKDDTYVSGGSDYTFSTSPVNLTKAVNPGPAGMYKSVRHLGPRFIFGQVADGDYRVRLHYLDGADTGGGRKMTVKIEGTTVETGFNIAAEAGGAWIALIKEYNVTVADGNGLMIEYGLGSGNDAFASGIEVISRQSTGIADCPLPPAHYMQGQAFANLKTDLTGAHNFGYTLRGSRVDLRTAPAGVYLVQTLEDGVPVLYKTVIAR